MRRIGNLWNEYCTALILIWNGWTDWRRQEVSLPCLGAAGAAGILANFLLDYQDSTELAAGIATGVVVLAISAATKGAVGFGDGLVLCVTGIFLGGRGNFQLITAGSLLCASVLGTGLVFGRVRWKQRFPFVPFLCAAQIGRILWK